VRYFEDFVPGDATDLGSHRVTEASIIDFARRYDPQPFHVDPAKAKDSVFGGLVASGWQTASIYMRLFVDRILGDTASLASPGVDELRWLLPVRPGDTVHGRTTVLETRPSQSRPDRGVVRTRGELFNQHGQLVMSLLGINFFARRPP
jgi:acyl dehydratase